MFGELEGEKVPEMAQGSKNLSFLACKFKDFVFYVLKSQLQDLLEDQTMAYKLRTSGND